jgi:hypothetical protein
MHPILSDWRRLLAYLLVYELLGGFLALLQVLNGSFSWQEALAFSVPLAALYGFICLGAFWVCRAAPLRTASLTTVAGVQLASAGLSASFWLLASREWASFLTRSEWLPGMIEKQRQAAPVLFGVGVLLFLLAATLHYLIAAFEASRQAERDALQFQVLSREAALRTLRAQIHPHFLFNSLNSINALITARPDEARRLCLLLGDFLRRSLTLGARDRVSLAEELALAEDLLGIEKVRFGERLRFECTVDDKARSWNVPPLLLQPLVENAVTHGIAQCLEGGTVRLDARAEDGRLHVAIQNPRDPESKGRKGTGIGLENVRRRLDAAYGHEATLRVRSDGGSFRVDLELPEAPPET